jgi:hypothetical protein
MHEETKGPVRAADDDSHGADRRDSHRLYFHVDIHEIVEKLLRGAQHDTKEPGEASEA